MKSTILVAIDPGVSGGIAWYDGENVYTKYMPETDSDKRNLFLEINSLAPDSFWRLENVGFHHKGNAAKSSATFAMHCGHLRGMLDMMGVSWDLMPARTWRKAFLGTVPKEKKAKDNLTKQKAQRLFPHLKVTHKTGAALGMLWVLMEEKG